MKTSLIYKLTIALLFSSAIENLSAQNINGGIVKCQQTTRYNFETIFNAKGDADATVKAWIAALPIMILSL